MTDFVVLTTIGLPDGVTANLCVAHDDVEAAVSADAPVIAAVILQLVPPPAPVVPAP